MFAGYSVGGVLAAVLAIALVADHGWRPMMALGGAPLLVVLPLAWRFLPESVGWLRRPRRAPRRPAGSPRATAWISTPCGDASPERRSAAARAVRARPAATLLFGAAGFCGLLLVYGLNTWLPQIMREAGYPLGSALTFLLVLNVGAIVGALGASLLADRFGSKPVTVAAFVVATGCLLAAQPAGGHGPAVRRRRARRARQRGHPDPGQRILAAYYPTAAGDRARLDAGRRAGRAIVGPLFGGWVLASAIGFAWNFYVRRSRAGRRAAHRPDPGARAAGTRDSEEVRIQTNRV